MSEVALFQLGMDLENGSVDHVSSTAQTEDHHSACGGPVGAKASRNDSNVIELSSLRPQEPCGVSESDERFDHFITREGVRCAGAHIIIDLMEAEGLDDLELMEASLRECVEEAKATLLHIHLHHFTPNGGISGVAVLAESHISVHSWPEVGYAAFDVFMCGDSKPEKAIEVLKRAFKPGRVAVHTHLRGSAV